MSDRLALFDGEPPTLLHELYRSIRAARRVLARKVRGGRPVKQPPADTVLARVKLDFEVMAYFSDAPINLYQLRQWLYPLERLDEKHRVFILTRNTETFQLLSQETHLSIVNARRIGLIDSIALHSDIKMAVYVNQTMRNFQSLRYPEMLHVFLSHGESEKHTYMATNQAKAYDFTFVAGDAAVERITDNLVRFQPDRHLVKIGRPQLDTPPPASWTPYLTDRTTVLYAPTWEGDRPSMSYGSLQSHGRQIVEALLASPRHRLVYRPHPRTGITFPEASAADRELRALVQQAIAADPAAGHQVDLSSHFGPQMLDADVLVADVSAVALDFLPTGKPVVVTVPAQPAATYDRSTFLGSVYDLPTEALPDLVPSLDRWLAEDPLRQERLRWVEHYFGDVTPGASLRRFLDACDRTLELRDELITAKRAEDAAAGVVPARLPAEAV